MFISILSMFIFICTYKYLVYDTFIRVKEITTMSSLHRKQVIQTLLKRGQLKQLSSELSMSYSYLSQVFSPAIDISFTAGLARKVEQALGLVEGQLDQGEIAVTPQKNPKGLLALVLRGRAVELKSYFTDKRVEIHELIEIGNTSKHADLVVYNQDDSIFMIAEQSKDYNSDNKMDQLIMLMAISGAEYGVVFAPDSGVNDDSSDYNFSIQHQRSSWYQSKNGKIVKSDSGPNGLYNHVGI